jgi:methanogenesis imperfect marker protein 11
MTVILRPDEVREKFGSLFCKGFFTLVDEENGIAQVVEKCIARGPVEWDAVNRMRAGGVITDIRIDGTTLIMDAVIGERELNFGPVTKDLGGQGLRALKVDGDKVRTTWVGLAGASVGIGACIPQDLGVVETEYPDDYRIGGAHQLEVTVTSPKMIRVVFGIDDTDTKEKGSSWSMALKLGQTCPIGRFLEHKIIQLNPLVPNKTTNCCSCAISFAVEEKDLPALVEYVKAYLKENTYSDDTTLTIFKGLRVPERLVEFGWGAKSIIYTIDDAKRAAAESGVEVVQITGPKGTIGAVAAIGCFDLGIRAAGLPEDFKD